MASEPVDFTYWSDPLCIWAFVAQPRLEQLLTRLGAAASIEYRIVPVFGSIPRRFAQGSWAAEGPTGRMAKTREIAHRFGHAGVDGGLWIHDPPASSWPAGAAAKAVFALETDGQVAPGTGARFLERMRSGFFVENRNLARRQEQIRLAETMEVPVDALLTRLDDGSAMAALWEDFQDKEALRIQGSPTYMFHEGRSMLYGNVAEDVLWATCDAVRRGLMAGCSGC